MPGIVPSRTFFIRAGVILLVFAGWFLLFRTDAPVRKNTTYERRELLAVASKPIDLSNETAAFSEPEPVEDEEQSRTEKYLRIFGMNYPADALTPLEIDSAQSSKILKRYGSEIKAALVPFTNAERPNEVELMLAILEKGSAATEETATLSALQKENEFIVSQLAAIAVPVNAKETHLALVDAFARRAQLTANMRDVLTDPIRAVASAQEFAREESKLFDTFQAINNYFSNAGVEFTPSESAKVTVYDIR